MTKWTPTEVCVPGDWELVVALDADQNHYLVEWDADKKCFWDQGTRYLKQELTCWMPVLAPPVEIGVPATLPLAS